MLNRTYRGRALPFTSMFMALFAGGVAVIAAACQSSDPGECSVPDASSQDQNAPDAFQGAPGDGSSPDARVVPADAADVSVPPDADASTPLDADASALPDGDASSSPPPDAEPDAFDGDADASSADASDADAGEDAAVFVEPSVGCAQQTPNVFCADFDTSSDIGAGWTWDYVGADGGALGLDTTDYLSAPAAAQVVCPGNGGQVQLGKNLPNPLPSHIRLAFDLRIDMTSLTGIAQTGVAQLSVGSATSRVFNYELESDGTAALGVSYGSYSKSFPLGAPKLQTWTRIAIDYTTSDGVTFYQDGQPLAADPTVKGDTANAPFVIVGGVYTLTAQGAPSVAVEIDNVVVRGE
ncbi:MAG TPA: hypothetical protein VGI39_10180 [Polyangiaceae bacterium]